MSRAASIPYFDLTRQYKQLKAEFETAVRQTCASGKYILGPAVDNFEEKFARYCGSAYGVGVGSGTDALFFSLKALGIGPGDEVIVPSFTFSASVLAIIHAGAAPVLADVDPMTYTLMPDSVSQVMTRRVKALLPVHLYGQTAEMDALWKLSLKRKLKIVEDACQAHGAEWKGKKAGSLGDAGCFSFYPTKNLGAFGDGGMVLTNSSGIAERIRKLRNLGRKDFTTPHEEPGWTSRLDALQAAILNVKLALLERSNQSRRKLAKTYADHLASTPLGLPGEGPNRMHVYHLYVVRVPNGKRDALKKWLAEQDIATMIHYPIPVHQQPFCRPYVSSSLRLPVTERLSGEILSLPMFPEMTEEEVKKVSQAIRKFYGRKQIS